MPRQSSGTNTPGNSGHAADVLARAHGGEYRRTHPARRWRRLAHMPISFSLQKMPSTTEKAISCGRRRRSSASKNDRVGAHGTQSAGQRGGEGAPCPVDPDELRSRARGRGARSRSGFLRADAHFVHSLLVARTGVKIQHEIRAAHILNHLMAHVFKRRAVRRAGKARFISSRVPEAPDARRCPDRAG